MRMQSEYKAEVNADDLDYAHKKHRIALNMEGSVCLP